MPALIQGEGLGHYPSHDLRGNLRSQPGEAKRIDQTFHRISSGVLEGAAGSAWMGTGAVSKQAAEVHAGFSSCQRASRRLIDDYSVWRQPSGRGVIACPIMR
jgi:hypothetical protein